MIFRIIVLIYKLPYMNSIRISFFNLLILDHEIGGEENEKRLKIQGCKVSLSTLSWYQGKKYLISKDNIVMFKVK